MDGARLSRYPHLAWLRFGIQRDGTQPRLSVPLVGVCHSISLVRSGRLHVRWMTRGRERSWSEGCGSVHFRPTDDDEHLFETTTPSAFHSTVILLPRNHVDRLLTEEWADPLGGARRILCADDPVLECCLRRLGDAAGTDGSLDGAEDEIARRLVLHLAALHGHCPPDWHDDESVFDRRTLRLIVERIDGHVAIAPSIAEMGVAFGLSPTHFARKFRRSTGVSLHRFINRRRLQAALDRLKGGDEPLASLAARLGFASQSHMTRLFSSLTGMTPARYRRFHRPTIG
jgi:AraC-like DNA-binding protein